MDDRQAPGNLRSIGQQGVAARRITRNDVTKPLIAIIEDDDSMRPALVGLVRAMGYEGEGFGSAESFLASDAAARAVCLISDYQLPGLSGIELAVRLRHQLPVILVTARTEPGIEVQAAKHGVLCVLRKPFEADELAGCIGSALAGKARV